MTRDYIEDKPYNSRDRILRSAQEEEDVNEKIRKL